MPVGEGKVGFQTFTIYSEMSQIVTLTDVIMWRSKWDSGIWQAESSRMAEQWELPSAGKKKKKWNDLWAGSIILSFVIPPGPASLFPLSTSLYFFLCCFYYPPIHPSRLCLFFQLHVSLSLYSARVVWLTSLTVSGLQLRFLLKHTLQRVFIVVPLYHPLAFTKQAWVIKLDKRQAMTVFGDKFPQRKYYNCPDPRLHGLQQ